ncbi:hypothetical protein GFS24_03355 [Chitinophaga sp. SYP-B3965]|uniref:hypothetical protein n=1 Tax=Chitinophaga sp. SYP-B3965 TaxID=2663120 RepID=UPI001299FDA1|nr:hypothetical protein [Chitinophaga sp. SYP-B3965]MRG44132.1 hypothetical protein [Chitinophaga sp. SYP-B3965]
MARIFCFLCLLLALRSTAQEDTSNIVTLKANNEGKQYKKILIAGCGQGGAIRHFMENLAPQVITHYQKQGVTCVYEFIGSDQASLKAGLNTAINNHQPDATLMMYQFYEKPDTLKTRSPSRVPKTLLVGSRYQQRRRVKKANGLMDEEVKLVVLEGKNALAVWQGQLNIIDETIRESLYGKLCFLLTEELSRNKINLP